MICAGAVAALGGGVGGVLFTVGYCVGCTPVGVTLNVTYSGSVVPLAAPYVCPQCYATFTHR